MKNSKSIETVAIKTASTSELKEMMMNTKRQLFKVKVNDELILVRTSKEEARKNHIALVTSKKEELQFEESEIQAIVIKGEEVVHEVKVAKVKKASKKKPSNPMTKYYSKENSDRLPVRSAKGTPKFSEKKGEEWETAKMIIDGEEVTYKYDANYGIYCYFEFDGEWKKLRMNNTNEMKQEWYVNPSEVFEVKLTK